MSFRLFTHRLFRHGRYFFTNYRNIRRDIHLNIFEKRKIELSPRNSGATSAAKKVIKRKKKQINNPSTQTTARKGHANVICLFT